MELTDRQNRLSKSSRNSSRFPVKRLPPYWDLRGRRCALDFSLLTMSGILQAKPKVGYLINEEHTNSVLVEQIAKQKSKSDGHLGQPQQRNEHPGCHHPAFP